MFFPVTTKNSNWEILTKNLVTSKRWDGVKDEKFWRFTEKSYFYGEGGSQKKLYRGNSLKRGSWTVLADLRGGGGGGGWQIRGGDVFEGVGTPIHTILIESILA